MRDDRNAHGKRAELQAYRAILEGLADAGPERISFGAASHLADAAASITEALQYAVDETEIAQLKSPYHQVGEPE